jgi:flagellar export protein FliJ
MAVSRALRRLLRIRDLEEEQARLALDSAVGGLNRLEQALAATAERDRGGRRLVQASARNGELPDRLAGLEETRAADRLVQVLIPRIAAAGQQVTALREEYLAARVERRQAETLIEEAEARDALDADRRSQQGLDDWFRNRLHRAGQQAEREARPAQSGDSGSGVFGGGGEGNSTGSGES